MPAKCWLCYIYSLPGKLSHHYLGKAMIGNLEAAPQCPHALHAQIKRVLAQKRGFARARAACEHSQLALAVTFEYRVQFGKTGPLVLVI